MKIEGDWISNPGTQALCAQLAMAGYQALFVGGCVRNALLDVPVADIDIATDAPPETVTNIAKSAGFRVIPTGVEHGTVTVLVHGLPHEVTTFRRDLETDGRRAVVAFSTAVEDDAARRDFTMNALYARADGTLIDPLNGLPDLLARRVRFVGDARARIQEDFLRILRFFRFHAVYGDSDEGIDPEGLAACAAFADGLDGLSRERVGAEIRKLLAAKDPAPSVASMAQAGVLARVVPGADAKALTLLVHLEAGLPPRWQRRLAVLGGMDIGEALRLSRAEIGSILAIRAEISRLSPPAVLGWRLGTDVAQDVVLGRSAVLETPLPDGWQTDVARGADAQFPVSAADLMPALQGEPLGAKLREIEAVWLASDLRLTKAQLLA